ncbi:sigma-70 family RNA polymerase sigma factor [Pseudofrankia inefficax]|uniref:RNA polymerase, sigma-24 subunit, ECF subfamily n=1 Tax=Pseudofrankia inefficax (strain DSM 45817 / CECT 9037 / DDB 130130 / EuI1c) TaxID=298654 RepID=E3J2Q9_PSEI1|nr:sigma-70 family RNA polymerase sigma factor [Pseudofrankia inefficax]ADP81720.1 RNA polymerase, sigma-24 subunit, ECF subfamily [Pseudofrankia inefficax]
MPDHDRPHTSPTSPLPPEPGPGEPGRGEAGGGEWLAGRFEEHRAYLRSVAYRMLGSRAEADDAVQEAWLRLARSDAGAIENLRAWLTTVVGRVCLNALRARAARREEPAELTLADPVVSRPDEAPGPEEQALLADAVGVALLVVLDTLDPPERLAFVLHDLFAVPFDEIAPMVGRSPQAARQLASRARRRVRGAAGDARGDGGDGVVAGDDARRRAVVEAFFAAARGGDLDGLLALLAPDAVLRADVGAATGAPAAAGGVRHGADAIARQALRFANPRSTLHPVLVNGTTGVVVTVGGEPAAVMAFTVLAGQIVAIDAWSGPDRLRSVDLGALTR